MAKCWRGLGAVLLLHVNGIAEAALPHLVDDAGIVPPGEVELFVFYEVESGSGDQLHALPVEVTIGVHPQADFTIASGYQYFDGNADEDGWMDTEAAAKVGVWNGESTAVSVEGVVKFPTASERKGLGSGDADAGFNVALTRSGERTAIDFNAGYLFAGSSESDELSLGAAVRRELNEAWEVFVEAVADVAVDDGSDTVVSSRVGATWQLREGILLGGGMGPSFGDDAPDFTGTVGLVVVF